MGNVATVIQFPANSTPVKPQEVMVADCDDGYTRLANDLLDALIEADLTKHQYKVALAVIRKTYGFNKPMDWMTNEQIAEATNIPSTRVSTAKNDLLRMGVLVSRGRKIGPNKVISDWETHITQNRETFPETGKESFPKTGKAPSLKQGYTKDNIQKTRKTKDQNISAEPAVADSTPVVIESVSAEPVSLPAKQPEPQEPVVIIMPLNSGEHAVTESFAAQMQALYPAVDVAQELRTMTGWLIANPTKRKTKTGINRFINSWLSKCQDRGGSNGLQGFTPRRNDHTDLTQTMTAAELNQRMQEGF
ncbi:MULTISPECIES: replication protein [Aeromonas]|uniref:replication protein n=1 Tax=Aeromonas TaxID=642 RepID=UPI00259DF365|nr:replication protein [Aeromonas salmonicida]MDM5112799.1 replication protein [Aeromonas salmonicida]